MGQSFDADEFERLKTGGANFVGELVGPVEVCRRPPLRVPVRIVMNSGDQIMFNDRAERRIEQVLLRQTIKKRSEPRHRSSEQQPTRSQHPQGLAQGTGCREWLSASIVTSV